MMLRICQEVCQRPKTSFMLLSEGIYCTQASGFEKPVYVFVQ